MLTAANKDRELQKMLYARCIDDPCFWFNTFVWTYDPREPTAKMPMVLFPRQEELLTWFAEREAAREGGLVEKSRDFGLTWLAGGYAVHGWLFREGVRYGFGSRKLELVDSSEDEKTIFAKLRFIIAHVPWWMRPKHLSKYLLLKNHENDSTISGEGGSEIGRGDRTSAYFVDEAASLAQPELADAALSQTTNCRFDISTPKGIGGSFYKKRHSGKVKVFRCHWKEDPRKNYYKILDSRGAVVGDGHGEAVVPPDCRVVYPWYEKECEKIDDSVIVAQEIDIDYTASVEGICIPAKWVQAAVDLHLRMPHLNLPNGGALRAGADLAGGGANKNVLVFMRGVVVSSEILSWRHDSPSYTARKMKQESEARAVAEFIYDAGGGYGGAVAEMAASSDDKPHFEVRAFNGGDKPTETKWEELGDNGMQKTSRDKFRNLRAECWWLLRERFRKTWEVVENGRVYAPQALISIPNHAELIADLSKPLVEETADKLIALESKEKMRKRGVASPDFADPLAQLMWPSAPKLTVFVR